MKVRLPDGGVREMRSVFRDAQGRVQLIDQRALPARVEVLTLSTVEEVADAIRAMAVRGAPAIGAAAAYGMALGASDPEGAGKRLGGTRPTARDLFAAIAHMTREMAAGRAPLAAADAFADAIVEACRAIGEHGATLLPDGARVLTHCNAGALAAVDVGTALAPLRAAHAKGRALHVWVDETRPRAQGLLTAWELASEGIAHAVIADNAAGHFMARGEVDCVIVGADRIVRNGDVANKIGTYTKAVLARRHGIPFYVAAPLTTFDPALASGDLIPIEERAGEEVTRGFAARNPAFDVTPADLVTGYVTEAGVLTRDRLPELFGS